ncbi:hypothetical protein [Luteococcus peritonei]|uniref:Uncharacterized protein n=1 Tax=Luteococcus peritonei TaxID=88874 RepID=A0ABW4RVD3_9ACTN
MADERSFIRGRGDGQRREFGRDGISGLVDADRAVRAREVSRPREQDRVQASLVLDSLLRRATGRRR